MAIGLTAALDTVSVPPRVVLTVSGAGAATTATIVCNEGVVRPVRGAEPVNVSGGVAVAFDYEARRDITLTWTVTASTGTAISNSVIVPSNNQVLLLHPGNPSLSVYINGDPIPSMSTDMQSAVYSPPGRPEAVYFSTGSDSEKGSIRCWTGSFVETQALKTLLRSGYPVRLLAPAAYMDSAPYLGILTTTTDRMSRLAWDQTRWTSATFQVVTRPISALQLFWTYAQLNPLYATYAAMNTAYTGKTYLDVSIGPA